MLTKIWKSLGVIFMCSLVACSSGKEAKNEKAQKNAIPEKVVLHIASDFNYPPFTYKDPKETDIADPNSNKKGLEVEILEELSKRLDFKVVFEELKFEEIIDAVSSGRVDGAIGGISITTNRKEKVLFTSPFYKSPIVSVVTIENTVSPADKDHEFDLFVVSDPDFTDFVSKQLSEKYKKLNVANFPLWEDVLQSFETKKGGIYVTDRLHAEHLVKETPNLRIVNEYTDQTGLTTGGGLHIAFAFNQKHDKLVMRINNEIQKMQKDGTLKQILEKVETPSTAPSTPTETVSGFEKKEEQQAASIEQILNNMESHPLESAKEAVAG